VSRNSGASFAFAQYSVLDVLKREQLSPVRLARRRALAGR